MANSIDTYIDDMAQVRAEILRDARDRISSIRPIMEDLMSLQSEISAYESSVYLDDYSIPSPESVPEFMELEDGDPRINEAYDAWDSATDAFNLIEELQGIASNTSRALGKIVRQYDRMQNIEYVIVKSR